VKIFEKHHGLQIAEYLLNKLIDYNINLNSMIDKFGRRSIEIKTYFEYEKMI